MSKRNDITGIRFNRLIAISKEYKHSSTQPWKLAYWVCKCDCGQIKTIGEASILSGRVGSCGCLRRKPHKAHKHGFARKENQEHLYKIWLGIKSRCSDLKNPYYGGKGIVVCDEWSRDYVTFRNWAISNGYNESLEIDRINSEMGYFPANCRFVTVMENVRNRRKSLKISYNGKMWFTTDLAKHLGIHRTTIPRMVRSGKLIAIHL